MACSTRIAPARRCWPSPRKSPQARSAAAIFRKRIRRILFRECSHYCELVSDVSQLPYVLENAIRAAVGQRGVAVVVIPGDVALRTGAGARRLAESRPVARRSGRQPGAARIGRARRHCSTRPIA